MDEEFVEKLLQGLERAEHGVLGSTHEHLDVRLERTGKLEANQKPSAGRSGRLLGSGQGLDPLHLGPDLLARIPQIHGPLGVEPELGRVAKQP